MINALSIIPAKTASCPVFGDCAISAGVTVKWGKQKKGDIVLFDFNNNGTSDHIGIVKSVNSDGTITTIEGNTSLTSNDNGGCVMQRTRYKGQVNYFVRPAYNSTVTADMVVTTALNEVGTKESPANSNNVKYNTWFYGKAVSGGGYAWCCTFVCWVFAHVQGEDVLPVTKPADNYGYVIPMPTLKLGSKGASVKELQRFLNWYCNVNLTLDGSFGQKTEKYVKIYKKTEGLNYDGIYGEKSYKRALTYTNQTVNGRTLISVLEPETELDLMTSYVGQSLAIVNSDRRAVFYAKRDGSRQVVKYYTAKDKTAEIGNFSTLGHCNGATLKGTQFHVCSYYGNKNLNRVTKISANNLDFVKAYKMSVNVSGIGYDIKKSTMVCSKGKTIYIMDGTKVKSKFTLKFADGTAQDIMAYNGYIYVCRSYVRGSTSAIDKYDYSGTYIGSYIINSNELESCDIDENGYMHYITWNKAQLVKTTTKIH